MKLTTISVSSPSERVAELSQQSPVTKKHHPFWDVLCVFLLIGLSLSFVFGLLGSQFFATGYGDWLIQAFRVKFIASAGLTSWTHIWSNGISLWRAYQFLPHAVTALLANLFNLEITRAMVIITLFQFLFLRLSLYFIARNLGCSPITALLAVILSYDIGQYWSGVDDFSILFGFTAFPIYLWLWIKYTSGKFQFLFPYLLGLAFYIHPLLGIYSISLWFTGLVFSPSSLSRPKPVKLALQSLVLFVTSSLFWIQHLSGYIKNYSSQFFTSLTFFRQTLSTYWAVGLSIGLIVGLVILVLSLPAVLPRNRWLKPLTIFILISFVAVVISQYIQLPQILAETQFSRGMVFVGLAIVVALMPVIEKIKSTHHSPVRYLIITAASLIIIESITMSSYFAPRGGMSIDDPVTKLAQKYPNRQITNSRVWSPVLDASNYQSPLTQQFPVSYMTHSDSNQVSVRFSDLLLYGSFQDKVPFTAINRISQYMRLTNTKYIIFDQNSPFTRTLVKDPNSTFEDLGEIDTTRNVYHAFGLSDVTSSATAMSSANASNIKPFPNTLNPADPQDQAILDQYVEQFLQVINQTDNTRLAISYPTQDSLDISIPASLSSSTIFVPESYSPNWVAKFNGSTAKVSPAGPNFIRVDFVNTRHYGLLSLTHSWPVTWYISILAIATLPLIYGLFSIFHLLLKSDI